MEKSAGHTHSHRTSELLDPDMERFHVRVAGDDMVFSAGHFITLSGNVCEGFHGHNYRVAAEVHGPLSLNHYVVDFVALRDALRVILSELDHRVLLPTQHPSINVSVGEQAVEVTFAQRRWVFPRMDCLLLPISNTTTELLARHVGRRLLDELEARLSARPTLVRIEVEESPGVGAVCELRDE
jgi:6-pyruvoyltetrahydropterin/6-carboxytetrahydropterin synthase